MDRRLDESAARIRFRELVARADVPLAEAALVLAQEEYPELSVEAYLRRLDELAQAVEGRLPSRRDAAGTLRALGAVLFVESRFRGNTEDYYDPRNSFLNEVLDRRLGLPITLSVVYIEVATRVGLPAQGVGFPGHFLVKLPLAGRELFVDPFHGGDVLSADDCLARFRTMMPGREIEPHHLEPVGPRQILRRVLLNLRRVYVARADDVRALWVMDRLVLLAPDDPAARRDRGLVEARLGGRGAALADLEAYLAQSGDADDVDEVRAVVRQLRSQGSLLN